MKRQVTPMTVNQMDMMSRACGGKGLKQVDGPEGGALLFDGTLCPWASVVEMNDAGDWVPVASVNP